MLPGSPFGQQVYSLTPSGFVYQHQPELSPLTEEQRKKLWQAANQHATSSRRTKIVAPWEINADGAHKIVCERATQIGKEAVRRWFPKLLQQPDDVIFEPFQIRSSTSSAHPTNIPHVISSLHASDICDVRR